MGERVLLHLGCGPEAAQTEWIDFDGSWNARVNSWPRILRDFIRKLSKVVGGGSKPFPAHVRYFDLRKKIPFADQTVDAIYASHVWEHLDWGVAVHATEECYRVLKRGGRIRLVVPDLREMIHEYLADSDATAALELQKRLHFHPIDERRHPLYKIYEAWTSLHYHKVMYDVPLLSDLLLNVGFKNPVAMGFLQSEIPEIRALERDTRVGPGHGFAIEAEK